MKRIAIVLALVVACGKKAADEGHAEGDDEHGQVES